jgi:hypothetical protein
MADFVAKVGEEYNVGKRQNACRRLAVRNGYSSWTEQRPSGRGINDVFVDQVHKSRGRKPNQYFINMTGL